MEKQRSAEEYGNLIEDSNLHAHTVCKHNCRCHRGSCIVAALCVFTGLLAIFSVVYVSATLVEVRSLRDDVLEVHRVACEVGVTVAGSEIDAGNDAVSEETGKVIATEETEERIIIHEASEPYDKDIGAVSDKADDYDDYDYDDEFDIEQSGDGFLMIEDDDSEDDGVSRIVKRSAHDSAPATRKKGNGKTPKKAGKRKRKAKGLQAAQFEATVPDTVIKRRLDGYDDRVNTEDCRHFSDMNGFLCRNKSFTPDGVDLIQMFHSAPWVNKRTTPIKITNEGVYTARSGGVYLVYAQVTFSDYEPIKGVTVEQIRMDKSNDAKTIQKSLCKQGLVLPLETMDDEQLMQSCTAIGLFKFKTGDTLQISSDNKYKRIERTAGSTHFGVVQLNREK